MVCKRLCPIHTTVFTAAEWSVCTAVRIRSWSIRLKNEWCVPTGRLVMADVAGHTTETAQLAALFRYGLFDTTVLYLLSLRRTSLKYRPAIRRAISVARGEARVSSTTLWNISF